MTTRDDDRLLTLRGVSRQFGDVVAVDNVSFELRRGTVHALLGENGAGKSTLMRIAFGMLAPDNGTLRVNDVPYRPVNPAQAIALGIGMVHQHFTLVPSMTVAENIALGGKGVLHRNAVAAQVRELSARSGLLLEPEATVGELPVSAQQRCEILKSLSHNASILIMDEPTAVLAPDEARDLLTWLRGYADAGNGVVLITHKLRDALTIADDVTVLRHGRVVLSAPRSEVDESVLASAMLGIANSNADAAATVGQTTHDVSPTVTPATRPISNRQVVAEVRNAVVRDARGLEVVRSVSLTLHEREIVGIAAVEGAGQHALVRLMAGRIVAHSGTVTLPDSVGFIPEDRHRDALMLDDDLVSNSALRDAGARRGRMPWHTLEQSAKSLVQQFDVRTPGVRTPVRALSGGNQQKLVVGRELLNASRLLVAENPTRGLDFNASRAVHAALRETRNAGAAVLLYSSDLDEVLALADRVLVMCEGLLVGVAKDREAVGRAMLSAV